MPTRSASLLAPEVVSRLGTIDFIARALVEGFLVGLHRSPYHGFSVEFAEYRQYLPGESSSNVDWRVFAKTDRHYVRLYHEETNLRARILLDISASMAATPEPGRISKLDYGRLLAAALAYLFIKQSDAVGLVTFDTQPREVIPPRGSRRQLHHVLRVLSQAEAGERTRVGHVLDSMADRMRRRGLICVISDLIDEPDEVLRGLKHFRHRKHEVLVFHVLDPREIDLDLKHEARFLDPEGELAPIKAQPWHMRESYQARVREWRERLGRECRLHRIDFVPLSTETPYDRALMSYMAKRSLMH